MATLDEDEASGTTRDDANVSHLIPALELKGSRGEKLKRLDALITQLHQLRRSLAGDVAYRKGAFERPGPHIESPKWPWLVAGTTVGALIVLLLVFARSCA